MSCEFTPFCHWKFVNDNSEHVNVKSVRCHGKACIICYSFEGSHALFSPSVSLSLVSSSIFSCVSGKDKTIKGKGVLFIVSVLLSRIQELCSQFEKNLFNHKRVSASNPSSSCFAVSKTIEEQTTQDSLRRFSARIDSQDFQEISFKGIKDQVCF